MKDAKIIRGGIMRGQVMTEYVLMLLMFVSIAFIMLLLLAAFMEYGWRITALVGWEPWC